MADADPLKVLSWRLGRRIIDVSMSGVLTVMLVVLCVLLCGCCSFVRESTSTSGIRCCCLFASSATEVYARTSDFNVHALLTLTHTIPSPVVGLAVCTTRLQDATAGRFPSSPRHGVNVASCLVRCPKHSTMIRHNRSKRPRMRHKASFSFLTPPLFADTQADTNWRHTQTPGLMLLRLAPIDDSRRSCSGGRGRRAEFDDP